MKVDEVVITGDLEMEKPNAKSSSPRARRSPPSRSTSRPPVLRMTEAEVVAAVAHEAGHVSESRWPGRILSPLAVFALMGFME